MSARKILFLFLASGFWLLANQCAQIVNPSGGKKDVKPPHALKYFPDSAKTNFTGKNIVIAFDEYIQLNDLQKQLVISPPMTVLPEVKAKGKTLLIELKDSLKKNTTYTFNFGDAIRDITENNAIDNFQYVFSTGSYIDSLSLKGTVKNSFDMKTEKGILVMLYSDLSDSVPYKKLSSYFAKTTAGGVYKINNIRAGAYKVFALKDANNNYLYDLPTEQIAFSDTLINIKKNATLVLSLFKEEPKKQKLLKQFVRGYGSIFLAYAKPVQSLSFKALNSGTKTETFITEYNKRKDTVQIWFPDFGNDSLHFQVTADGKVIDTVKICTCLFEKAKQGRGEVFKLNVKTNIKQGKVIDLGTCLELKFNHPIKKANCYNCCSLLRSSLKEDYCGITKVGSENMFIIFGSTNKHFMGDSAGKPIEDSLGNKIYAPDCIPADDTSQFSLFIPPATFTDIFGLTNDTIRLDFKTQEEKYYGTLKLTLKMKIRIKYILQLLNEKGEAYDYYDSDKGIFSYKYLPPGSYKLRIIYDKNGDDKWTTGDYLSKQKPETVIYYPSPVTIRSNWDLELDWKVE